MYDLIGALSEVTIRAVTKVRCSYFSLNRFEATFGRIAHALRSRITTMMIRKIEIGIHYIHEFLCREHEKRTKSSRRDSVHSLRFHDVSIHHFDVLGLENYGYGIGYGMKYGNVFISNTIFHLFFSIGYLGRGSFGIVKLVRKKALFSRMNSLNSMVGSPSSLDGLD